jgi:hypothetical protein
MNGATNGLGAVLGAAAYISAEKALGKHRHVAGSRSGRFPLVLKDTETQDIDALDWETPEEH